MRIKVVLFAVLAQRTGVNEVLLDLPDRAVVADAVSQLAARFDAVAQMQTKLATAVNLSYVGANEPLHDGDELALIPPVSGG